MSNRYTIIVPHGVTPTGFGIRQRSTGALRPISKCCGRTMEGIMVTCKTCSTNYATEAVSLGASLSNDIVINTTSNLPLIQGWVQKVTGLDEAIMVVSET